MKISNRISLAAYLVAAACGIKGLVAETLPIPLGGFTFTGTGKFYSDTDRRDLFQIDHPWEISDKGSFGKMSASVEIPAGSQPPYYLHFYTSDNNSDANKDFRVKAHDSTAFVDFKPGHRFKEISLDGKPIWSTDVFDGLGEGNQVLDITPYVKPGVPFVLTAEIRDEVSSSERLPGDRAEFSDTRKNFNTPDKYLRFETKSYWGDFEINHDPAISQPVAVGSEIPAHVSPEFLAVGQAAFFDLKTGLPLDAELLELLHDQWPWPVQMGLPFAQGVIRDVSGLRLSSQGAESPAKLKVMNRWPDGSVRWASLSFTMTSAWNGKALLKEGQGDHPRGFENPVAAQEEGGNWNIANSRVKLVANQGPGALFELSAGLPGGEMVKLLGDGAELYLDSGGRHYAFRASTAKWLEQEEAVSELELAGELAAEGQKLGKCRLRAAVFAGCPYVRILLSFDNETRADTKAGAYGWMMKAGGMTRSAVGTDWMTYANGSGALTVAIKNYAQQGPNGFGEAADSPHIFLYRGDKENVLVMHPGEAKTHEIWLAFTSAAPSPEMASAFSAMANTPPRLNSSELIRKSMVWGEIGLATAAERPEEHALIEEKLLPFFLNTREDFRSYGSLSLQDSNYANFYWNTVHTQYALYAMTGDRKWFDLAERSSRQYMDAVLCHWSADQSEIGGAHGYEGPLEGPNRQDYSNRPFMIRLQYPHPCFDHWNMTVDPQGYELGVRVAQFTIRNDEMYKAARLQSARHQGWNLMDMSRAWQETGNQEFLNNASSLIETVRKYVEPRRGTYLSFHGNMSQPGAQPFMDGILGVGLRRYFQVSGRDDVLSLMSRVTDSVFSEAGLVKEVKGQKVVEYLYSPDPYQRGPDGFKTINRLNPTYAGNQAYLACLLRDSRLAEISLGTWKAFLLGDQVNASQSCFDLPAAVYWTDQARNLTKSHENPLVH